MGAEVARWPRCREARAVPVVEHGAAGLPGADRGVQIEQVGVLVRGATQVHPHELQAQATPAAAGSVALVGICGLSGNAHPVQHGGGELGSRVPGPSLSCGGR